MQKTQITDLLEAGVHFGHQTKRWNPKMKPYVYGKRNGITIFDLTITMRRLAEACAFLRDTVASGHRLLFVGAKRQAQDLVREVAEECGMYFMCDRWLGGTLTNHKVVLSRVARMRKLQEMETSGEMAKLPKKEIASLRRERAKLERTLGGIAEMRKLPGALIVIDVGREDIAVKEANKLGIPVVGLTDSNCDPDPIDYVIPGNDDALRALKVTIGALTSAIKEGLVLSGQEPIAAPAAKEEAPAEAPADEAKEEAPAEAPADEAKEEAPADTPADEAKTEEEQPAEPTKAEE